MARKTIYSASLERLPYTYSEWEAYRRNPTSNGLTDRLPGENPDWLRRQRAEGSYTDYDFGNMWRFSEEGTYPGIDSQSEDDGSPLKLLSTCARNDLAGKRRFVLNIEE